MTKYLHEELNKTKYGLDTTEKKAMRDGVRLLIQALMEDEYDQTIACLRTVLRNKAAVWFEYFDVTWSNCKSIWCSYLGKDVPHLGNNTNNR